MKVAVLPRNGGPMAPLPDRTTSMVAGCRGRS